MQRVLIALHFTFVLAELSVSEWPDQIKQPPRSRKQETVAEEELRLHLFITPDYSWLLQHRSEGQREVCEMISNRQPPELPCFIPASPQGG